MLEYDLIVIGAGPGGYMAALKAAGMGKKTALVERRELGGTCLNRGCIPTKTMMHSAELFGAVKNCQDQGIHIDQVGFNLKKMHEHKEKVISQMRDGIGQLLKKQKVDVYYGTGTILENRAVEVEMAEGKELLKGNNILIATGSRPFIPPIPGADLEHVVDSTALLQQSENLYKRLIIIGGGVIGMEFATIYSAYGCEVTVIEAMDKLLPNMDREISQNLKMIMKKRGVSIHTGAMVTEIKKAEDGLCCCYTEKEIPQEVIGDGVLISIGRRPETEKLFGEEVNIKTERGYLKVNERFETSIPGIYAIGDVIGGTLLAHVATAEGLAAVAYMFGEQASQNLNVIPSCVYTNPEIACVGITADEAKAAGIEIKTGKYIMSANGKSILSMQERGFVKIICEASSGKILGAQLMCARATDLIGEIELAMVKGLTAEDLASIIMPHPTFSEGIGEAAALVK